MIKSACSACRPVSAKNSFQMARPAHTIVTQLFIHLFVCCRTNPWHLAERWCQLLQSLLPSNAAFWGGCLIIKNLFHLALKPTVFTSSQTSFLKEIRSALSFLSVDKKGVITEIVHFYTSKAALLCNIHFLWCISIGHFKGEYEYLFFPYT